MGTRQQAWAIAFLVFGATGGTQAAQLPEPLATAVMLLGWSGDEVPRIEVVNIGPSDRTTTAEAWVRFDANDHAIPVVYVRSDTEVYRDALMKDYQALVRLAGVLAHERWHLRHGRDESGAYDVQLSTMEYLHADAAQLAQVRRALMQVRSGRK
jgi:hypothetical protein